MRNTKELTPLLGFKRSIAIMLCMAALALGAAAVRASPSQPINPPCVELNGTFYFVVLTFGENGATAHGEGVVKVGDEIIATFVADYSLNARSNGVIQSTASHVITFLDGSGTIITSDEIRLLDGRANSRLYIV